MFLSRQNYFNWKWKQNQCKCESDLNKIKAFLNKRKYKALKITRIIFFK